MFWHHGEPSNWFCDYHVRLNDIPPVWWSISLSVVIEKFALKLGYGGCTMELFFEFLSSFLEGQWL